MLSRLVFYLCIVLLVGTTTSAAFQSPWVISRSSPRPAAAVISSRRRQQRRSNSNTKAPFRPSTFLQEKETGETGSDSPAVDKPVAVQVRCPDCNLCDGSGRISGGIGAVLDWWPIKAYRPCPNFIERGGNYQRSGQGLDEIAFGRDSTFDPKDYIR